MAQRMDPDEFFDGGWEAGVDHGDLIEDVMLGVVHPYDRSDGYTPAHRWGTRHQLISESFADPAELADRGKAPSPAVRLPPPRAVRRPRAARQPSARLAPTAAPRVTGTGTKQQRQASLAQAMGWTTDELKSFRLRMATAFTTITDIKGKARRRQALAAALGISVGKLQRFQEAEARVNGTTTSKSKPIHQVAVPSRKRVSPSATNSMRREDLVRESVRLGRLLTSSGAEARLYETGWMLGIDRAEVARILQRRDRTAPARPKAPKPLGQTTAPKRSKLDKLAERIGLTASEVLAIREARQNLDRTAKRQAIEVRDSIVAHQVGLPVAKVTGLRELEAAGWAPTQRPAYRSRQPKANAVFCPACGARVDPTGWCRCS